MQPSATAVIRGSIFVNSDKGLYVGGNGTVNIDSACVFNGNAIGIHCYSTGTSTTIRNSTVNSNTTNGILCDNSSHPLIQGNVMYFNATGLNCTNNAAPTVNANLIKSNANGVVAASGGDPGLGTCCGSGNNTIAHNTAYHVVNWNEAITIVAQNNCWNRNSGNCQPPGSKIIGSVDASSAICCTASAGSSEFSPYPEPENDHPKTAGIIAVVPNPFNPSTTIHYSVDVDGPVRIAVYDVGGRFVYELVNRSERVGVHRVEWNGVDSRGAPAASGIYFVKLSAGTVARTMKMVLLK